MVERTPGVLDLRPLGQDTKLSVSYETPETAEERAVRLKIEGRSAMLADVRMMVMFGIAIVVLMALFGWSAHTLLLHPDATAESREWAKVVLGVLLSGLVSYLFGEAIGKSQQRQ